MAGAKTGVHVVQLKEIQVPDSLTRGNKFIKWDDDSSAGVPVTLKVDPNGYILYWKDQRKTNVAKEMDCLDISLIRDTRTGKYAKLPKDSRLRDMVAMGSADTALCDKMLTICYGTDMVNVSFVSFSASSQEVAKLWADELFVCATNLLALNRSPLSFLEKAYKKLCLVMNSEGRIPTRNIIKMFAQNKDDRKKVEKALEAACLPTGKNDHINVNKFQFKNFMTFYCHLCGRQEVDKIFHDLGAKKKPYLTSKQFMTFLNEEQRDPRLNEILYPFYDVEKAQTLIDLFEQNHNMSCKDSDVPKGHLSQEAFLQYLLSAENALIAPEKLDLSEDMDQPLAHYFINSSHNTYLTGHQLTGRSSVEIYRQTLLTGCRCVELDCWDGRGADEEPIITHGFTMCTEILFKEVIEAIAETAFKVSEYPVILSFENHCSQKQQAKMALHCRNIFGDMLLTDNLGNYLLEPSVALPPPSHLKRKIIVKNKKRHCHKSKVHNSKVTVAAPVATTTTTTTKTSERRSEPSGGGGGETETGGTGGEEEGDLFSESDIESEDDDDLDELTAEEATMRQNEKKEKGTAGQEAEAGMEMSELVNYMQPVHFHSFDIAEKRNRSYECTSFVETQATALLKELPMEFVNYNKRQLTRIYPKGTRVDSSNYMPQIFWNAGCQLVALNFQTLDLAMQLNLGIFEYNGRSGMMLKPDFMRRRDRRFDPFAESTVDGIVAGTVQVQVISGQLLTDKKVGTYVEVEMFGLPADTVRKKFKTKVVPGNGLNPIYNEQPFVFKKVVLPNLATLRIIVSEENGKLLGQRVLPVEGLRPGYRHICMRNELNQPQNTSTLFVHIKVGDYVSDEFADFAAALVNPIAYQTALEKHAEQLAVLEEDFEMPDDEEEGSSVTGDDAPPGGDIGQERSAAPLTKRSVSGGSVETATSLSRDSSSRITRQGTPQDGGSNAHGTPGGISRMLSSNSSCSNPDNGGSPIGTSHQPFTSTTRLTDADIIQEVSIAVLQQSKAYLKLLQKREKELEILKKKLEKGRTAMRELHELQEEKLVLSHCKQRAQMEKVHVKGEKRASQRGGGGAAGRGKACGELAATNQQALHTLARQQSDVQCELKVAQAQSMLSLCHDHVAAEADVRLRHVPALHGSLTALVETHQGAQLRRLDDLHDCEVGEMKRKLDTTNRDEMKALAKRHRDKNELSRMKREAMQKHINLAVQERSELRDILGRRKTEVNEKYEALRSQVADERLKMETCVQEDQRAERRRLELQYKAIGERDASAVNDVTRRDTLSIDTNSGALGDAPDRSLDTPSVEITRL